MKRLKEHIRALLSAPLVAGLEALDKEAEPYIPAQLRELVDKLPVPEDFKKAILPALKGGSSTPIGQLAIFIIGTVVGGLFGILFPFSRLGTYLTERIAQTGRLPPTTVFHLWWKLFKGEGIPEELLYHLRDQGWSDDTIMQGLEASKVMPTHSDIVSFLAKEVFEPSMIEKYKLDSEWEEIDKEFAKRIGLDEDTLRLYWRNHWVHPALTSVYSMLHRGLITDRDMFEYYRLVEIPEYWRDKLTELSWDLPNRIELRMMARYLDLDRDYLIDMLRYVGLKEEYREDVADFMIIMGLRGYWAALYRNGWMSPEELEREIGRKIVRPEVADRIYKSIVREEKPIRLEEHRRLTRSLIIRGLKKGIIDREQAIKMLMRHQNYARPEAEFIVAVEIGMEGSPETPLEFRKLVEEYRRAMELEHAEIPDELIELEKEIMRKEEELRRLKEEAREDALIARLEADLVHLRWRFTTLMEGLQLS